MKNYKVEITESGFTVWLRGRWFIDGSMFLKAGQVRFSTDRFDIEKKDNQIVMTLKEDE